MNNKNYPLVSIVMPTYNQGRYIGRALKSVIDQTYENWEIVIIDNQSNDNTAVVVSDLEDPRISFLTIDNDGVIAKSRNAGIREANGEWIAFLDSDDWWSKDKLEYCVSHIHAQVDFIYHSLEIITHDAKVFTPKYFKSRQLRAPVLEDLLVAGNIIGNSSVLVRTSLIKQMGGLCEKKELITCEDYMCWLKIAELTDKFVYLPKRLGFLLVHETNMSNGKTSEPARLAVVDFLEHLPRDKIMKVEARLSYIDGKYNLKIGKYDDALANFVVSIEKGTKMLRIKAISYLITVYCKKMMHYKAS